MLSCPRDFMLSCFLFRSARSIPVQPFSWMFLSTLSVKLLDYQEFWQFDCKDEAITKLFVKDLPICGRKQHQELGGGLRNPLDFLKLFDDVLCLMLL